MQMILLAAIIWPLILGALCLAGYALAWKKRGLDFWAFGLALGSGAFVSVFHLSRYLLNIPFVTSLWITLGSVGALAATGVFRLEFHTKSLPRSFLVSLAGIALFILAILPTFPGWDMRHHIPAVMDLMSGIHPARIAEGVRPPVAGGFYHYGVEALVAVGSFITHRAGSRYLFRLIELVFSCASFWLVFHLYARFTRKGTALVSTLLFFGSGSLLVFWKILVFGGKILPGDLFVTSSAPAPITSFMSYMFQSPMAFGFPLFLVILYLLVRGGLKRSVLAGALVGPLLLMEVFLGVSALAIAALYPLFRGLWEKRWAFREWGASLAVGGLSVLATGFAGTLMAGQGHNIYWGVYWLSTMKPDTWWELVLSPGVHLGLAFILAILGAIVAVRDKVSLTSRGASLVAASLLVGFGVPMVLSGKDFVKFFLLAGFGFMPLAGIGLAWLWAKGKLARGVAVLSVALMSVTPLVFLVSSWSKFLTLR